MKSQTVVVVQARMRSTRLPGKVLFELDGQSVLSHVLNRCKAIKGVDVICCAIPDEADCDPIAVEAERCGSVVFRGSESDVLDRYFQAAEWLGANIIMRITSDCPLIDPTTCSEVIKMRKSQNADFAANNLSITWPHGYDCEVMTMDWLKRAWREATEAKDREHVTPYIRRHPGAKRANLSGPGGEVLNHRWTLDYPEDLDFFRALFAVLPSGPQFADMNQVIRILEDHPEIMNQNQIHHVQRSGQEQSFTTGTVSPSVHGMSS